MRRKELDKVKGQKYHFLQDWDLYGKHVPEILCEKKIKISK